MDWVVLVAYVVGSYFVVALATKYLWRGELGDRPDRPERDDNKT